MIDTVRYARGQIYWREYNATTTPGVISKKRPVLIVSNNVGNAASGIVLVAPLTSAPRKSNLPTQVEVFLDGIKSWIMTEQIICISQKSLTNYIATVTEHKMDEVDEAIKISLGLSPISIYNSSETRELSSDINSKIPDATEISSINNTDNVIANEVNSISETSSDSKECEDNKEEDVKAKKRRKNYTSEEKLAFCVDYEDAKANKGNREIFLKKYEINSFSVASNYYKRFKNSLGV